MEDQDLVVIGGGPAGLFAAVHVAVSGRRVLLLEKNARPGAKLLLAGTGQCNITHDGPIRDFFTHYGSGPHGKFVKPALLSFKNTDLTAFFSGRGLAMVPEANGKVFPKTRRSEDVLAILLAACGESGVTIRCSEPVTGIHIEGDRFLVTTGSGSYRARSVLITTGGASYPRCGTTGDGYRLALELGQPVTEIAPALTPLLIRQYPFTDLAGLSFAKMRFEVWRDNKKLSGHTGDLLFTHHGLSGPGILDASREILAGDTIRLSFCGSLSREEFAAEITRRASENPGWQVGTLLAKYSIPERLVRRLLEISGIPDRLTCAHFPAEQRRQLVGNCTGLPLEVSSLGDFSVAMATRGGVALEGVNAKTLESKLVPGLFFAGEVLDIDGDTGGYNLQAAFSTGFLAAQGICRRPV